jgi:hypothetical protein
MNDIRTQPLSERFASIITVMLGMIRAQGLRSLLHLPALWLAAREIRRFGEAFGALIAAFEAGTLPPAPPARPLAPMAAPQDQQATCAQPAPARPRTRSPGAARAVPAPRRPCSEPARARVRTRPRAVPRPALSMPLPAPLAVVRAAGPQKNPVGAALPSHVRFITISKPFYPSAARQKTSHPPH